MVDRTKKLEKEMDRDAVLNELKRLFSDWESIYNELDEFDYRDYDIMRSMFGTAAYYLSLAKRKVAELEKLIK